MCFAKKAILLIGKHLGRHQGLKEIFRQIEKFFPGSVASLLILRWRMASKNTAAGPLLFQTWTARQFAGTEVRSSQAA